MWQHRNEVRTRDPTRHYQRDELGEANQAIAKEWEIGRQGLLTQDYFLFRSRTIVNEKPLPLKWEWLALVTAARAAAAADTGVTNDYEHERTSMREWLRRHNPTATRIRDGPQTTNNKKNQDKKKKTKRKYNKKVHTTTQKRTTTSKTSTPQPPAKRRRKN
jgi:hypothetical protein